MIETPPARLAIWLLASFATVAALQLAEDVLAPIVFALVVGIILSPVTRFWERVGMPSGLGAALTVLMTLLTLAGLIFAMEPYISRAIQRAPLIWEEMRFLVQDVQSTLRGLDEVSEDVAEAMSGDGQAGAERDVAEAVARQEEAEEEAGDAIEVPSAMDALFYAPAFAAKVMVFIGTLYFFLLVRFDAYEWITRTSLKASRDDLLEAEREVARYFLTITLINGTFGAIVAMVLFFLDMPYPIMWGITAFLANYILYLGPVIFAAALLIGGVVAFEGPYSVLPAALYVGMNMTEGQFVTPSLVGRQMSVNPLLVFLSLCIWLWLWGPVGAFVAIPILVWVKVIIARRQDYAQTISSGTPGTFQPNRLADSTG